MNREPTVRLARYEDIPRVIEIEKTIWRPLGTHIFSSECYEWIDIYPQGFLVAETERGVDGFSYFQCIKLDPDLPGVFTTFDELTDNGLTRKTHNINGNYHFMITTCSVTPGCGKVLIRRVLDYCAETKKPFFGSARMPNLDEYLKTIERGRILSPEEEMDATLFYAIQCVIMVGGRVSDKIFFDITKKFPEVKKPDPVLSNYIKNPEFQLICVVKNFMQDPESRNYSAILGEVV